jgi:alpha-beta hydrolase superfamily lysophospholipase
MSAQKNDAAEKVRIPAGIRTTAEGNSYTLEYTTLLSGTVPLNILMMTPKTTPTAIVQLLHGMCEYKERYLAFMERLVDAGYACIIHDHRGHGGSVLSSEDYGYMYDAHGQTLVEDSHQITIYAKRKWPGLPLVLFGHSMGSLIARVYLKTYDYEPAAVILSGPPCDNSAAPFGLALVKSLSKVHGGRSRDARIDSLSVGVYSKAFPGKSRCAWICTDEKVVSAYEANPLCHYTFTLNGYECLMELLSATYSKKGWHLTNPALPILFAAGTEDPCAGSLEDFKHTVMHPWKMGYFHVQWKRYEGMRHEILNEPNADTVINDFLYFIKKSLKAKNVPNSQHAEA